MMHLATMTSVCPDWTLDTIASAMKRHGYRGLEPRVEWDHAAGIEASMTPAERRAARDRLAGEGLEFCCVATGARMAAADPAERARQVEDLRRYIELAGDLGAPYVRTFGGEHAARDLLLIVDYVADGYRAVMDEAEARSVTVLMETHDRWSASAPVRAVVERVGHDRCAVLWDLLHPMRLLERPEVTAQNLAGLVRHLHVHDCDYGPDGSARTVALGAGRYDHEPPLRLLAEAGFDGYCSVEVIHRRGSAHDADAVLGQYAGTLRKYLSAASASE